MNKKYIKPSIIVEKAQLKTLMETVSIKGDIDDASSFTVNAKGGNVWDDEDEE
jgi:hypothetical protein